MTLQLSSGRLLLCDLRQRQNPVVTRDATNVFPLQLWESNQFPPKKKPHLILAPKHFIQKKLLCFREANLFSICEIEHLYDQHWLRNVTSMHLLFKHLRSQETNDSWPHKVVWGLISAVGPELHVKSVYVLVNMKHHETKGQTNEGQEKHGEKHTSDTTK